MSLLIRAYYQVRPMMPRTVRLYLRRGLMHCQRMSSRDVWPIDPRAAAVRPPWKKWPQNKKFALVLTHDVELKSGLEKCRPLAEIEAESGFRSSFNFVAEKYTTPPSLREELKSKGFEVGVHGLLHDGKLYNSRQIFMERARRINQCLPEWGASGFRSPSMQHNLDWLHELNILYDASTFDTDPFEPNHEGMGTVFPFWVPSAEEGRGYAELPYTLPQDSSLYLFLREKNIEIWKRKLDWVVRQGGMALINTHPDYMSFSSTKPRALTYPADFYRQFLDYVVSEYAGQYWHVLPGKMAEFVRDEYMKSEGAVRHE